MKLSNKTYNILAFTQRILCPILSLVVIFLGTMSETWGFYIPVIKVDATITALQALLGGVLAIVSKNYFDNLEAEAKEDEVDIG